MTPLLTTVLETREASRRLVRELDVIKSKVGLAGVPYTQGHILLYLEVHGVMTIAELAEFLQLDKSTTSRAVTAMVEGGYLKLHDSDSDRRVKPISLTARGKALVKRVHDVANTEVEAALETLSAEERETVIKGMQVYAKALYRSRIQRDYEIRKIRKRDNAFLSRVICQVRAELKGRSEIPAVGGQELKAMYETYRKDRAAYYVVTHDGSVVGGAGITPLLGKELGVCELRNMYLLQEARGAGIGSQLLQACLDEAKVAGYKKCYLEIAREMTAARALYEKNGFKKLDAPLVDGRRSDAWFARAV